MKVALIQIFVAPFSIIELHDGGLPPRLILPSGDQVHGAAAGWTDGAYALVPVEDTLPTYDPETEVREGPVVTVLIDRVTRISTVRPMTAAERAAVVEADAQRQLDMVGEVGFKALFLLDNRSRKLAGSPPIDQPTFAAQIKALRRNPVPSPDPSAPMTLLRFDAAVAIGAVAGAAFTDKAFAVPGLLVGDIILAIVFPDGLTPATVACVPLRVSAAGTLAVRFLKNASGAVTPQAPQALSVLVWRP